MNYQEQSYFDAVVKAFVENGLTFINQVQISTDDFQFHFFEKARITDLIFYVEGRACIIHARLSEIFDAGDPDESYQSWAIETNMCFSSIGAMYDASRLACMIEAHTSRNFLDYALEYDTTPHYRFRPVYEGFRCTTASSVGYTHTWYNKEQGAFVFDAERRVLDPATFAYNVCRVIEEVEPYLSTERFPVLFVRWSLNYSFGSDPHTGDLSALYWTRFGRGCKVLTKLIQRAIQLR